MAAKKILIADYDSASLTALADLFRGQGLEVLTAADGAQAYDLYKSEGPDLVLLEAMLPKVHGFDLTSIIARETEGALPVVIVTGLYKGAQYKNEALRSFGAADYFEKPYNKEALVNAVLSLLNEKPDFDVKLPTPAEVVNLLKKRLENES